MQSIIPAPVRSRSAFTSFAEIATSLTSGLLVRIERPPLARRGPGGGRGGGLVGREAGLLGLAAGALLGLALLGLLGLAPLRLLALAPLGLLALAAGLLLLGAELRRLSDATFAIASMMTLQERMASSFPGIT